jgi:serine/threonine-protein kinase RsbW
MLLIPLLMRLWKAGVDHRVTVGLLAAAVTLGIASYPYLNGRNPQGFTTPAPRTIGLRGTEVTYPGGTEHIRAVRADVRSVLDDCPRADDMVLCASELAANAAQHSRSRLPGGTFTVRATVSPEHYARLEVQDNGGPWTPATAGSARHHGLDIIRAVADEWGIDGGHAHRIVWARFDWHDPGPGPAGGPEVFKDRNRSPGTGGRRSFLADR